MHKRERKKEREGHGRIKGKRVPQCTGPSKHTSPRDEGQTPGILCAGFQPGPSEPLVEALSPLPSSRVSIVDSQE